MASFVFGLIVLALIAVSYARPGVAAGLTICGFAIEQCAQAFVPIAGSNSALMNYILALIVVVAVLRQVGIHGFAILLPRGPTWPPLLLLGYCYLSIAWSIFPSVTERSMQTSLPYLVVFVGLAPLTIRSPRDLSDAFLSIIFGATLSFFLLLSFAEWRGRGVLLLQENFNSNPLALTQAAGASLICLTLSPVIRRLPRLIGPPTILVALTTVVIVFLRTGSRGQIISAIGTLLLFTAATRRGIWFVPASALAMSLIGSGLLQEEVRINESRWSEQQIQRDLSVDRIGSAERLLDYWFSSDIFHQVFGLGNSTAADPRLLGNYPHVVPIEVLCEEGLVGASLLLAALSATVYSLIKAIRQSSHELRSLFITVLALVVYEFLITLKQGSLISSHTFLTLLVLPSCFVTFSRTTQERRAMFPRIYTTSRVEGGA